MRRSLLLFVFALLVACGIKGSPRPSRKPPPKAEPPAPVQPLPPKEPVDPGALDGGVELADGGLSSAEELPASADAGAPDAGVRAAVTSDAGPTR